MPETAATIRAWQTRFEKNLPGYLPEPSRTPPSLQKAMHYSAMAGGKRIRPLFVYAAGRALNLDENSLDGIAAAIELIHTYSLIHDDLPSMDDDDLRRGQPSCHREFDEATAILAGDALQALAFEILAADPTLSSSPQQQVAIILGLARACGASGMAGGQVLDLDSLGKQISQAELEKIHAFKTGALIQISTAAPALLSLAPSSQIGALSSYGQLIGLAFQVFDDLLDVTGSSDVTGKPSRADAARLKPAFPAVIGVEKSLERAHELRDSALMELAHLPGNTDTLEWLAAYAVDRDR
ncbi:MAG: polyprenyl synthetase family protein [Xanthomonadales bacterium]|nr:polyprenyl synthetase family protein [Xanthomonadales bacterium]